MKTHIITVATHNRGKLQELINNKYNVNVKVLGYGQKWTGFTMKYDLVSEYIKDLDDQDIIVFLDGFDSLIMKEPQIAVNKFIKSGYKLLFSRERNTFFGIVEQICGNCKDGLMANPGLYIGYVKYLKIFLKDMKKIRCKDDQVNLNKNCHKYDFISIDKDEEILQNVTPWHSLKYKDKAIFVSYPGTITIDRILRRGVFDYSQFFTNIIYLILVFLVLIILSIKNKNIIVLLFLIILSLLYILTKMDKSCNN
tara:strand:- start:295 stop:1053 length:759 start_codon:yes stop_codon:yes gene_type:complete